MDSTLLESGLPKAESEGEVVVITGATAGVGRATARLFAAQGAKVALLARGRDGLEATRREVEELGGEALPVPTDVADADAVDRAAAHVEDRLGGIDVWVNNAMVTVFSPIKDMTAAEFQRVTEVTYLGYVHGTLAALRHMLPRNRGVIVQVGSALAYRSVPLQAAYCAGKHAIVGFTEALRTELLHDKSKVRVIMVHMPALNTPQFGWLRNRMAHRAQPVPPIYQPELAARAILWAAKHPRRRELFVGWSALRATWADRLAASLADHYLARRAWGAQQTAELEVTSRRDNLWEPVPGDHGARGRFGQQARHWSSQQWPARHHWLAPLAIGLGTVAAAWAWRRT